MEICFTCIYTLFVYGMGGVEGTHISSCCSELILLLWSCCFLPWEPQSLWGFLNQDPGQLVWFCSSFPVTLRKTSRPAWGPNPHPKHCFVTKLLPRKAAISFLEPTGCFLPGKRHQPWTQFKRRTGSSVVGSQRGSLSGTGWRMGHRADVFWGLDAGYTHICLWWAY